MLSAVPGHYDCKVELKVFGSPDETVKQQVKQILAGKYISFKRDFEAERQQRELQRRLKEEERKRQIQEKLKLREELKMKRLAAKGDLPVNR